MKVSNSSPEDFGDAKCWPPGFRFHPTDEELVLYYLKRKICRRRLRLNVIGELDVYKWEPEELPGLSALKTGDRQWFFFSPRDRRYPNGGRVNRATRHGYWKATGKDRNITCNSQTVGVKKTLVFYKGRAPSGERTDWVMHEYTVDEEELKKCQGVQDSCALYKVFKKSGAGPKNGEQYGAPFREEEWADDDEPVDLVQQLTANTSVDSFTVCDQGQLPDNDVEEIWGRLANDPITSPPQIDDFSDLLCLVSEEVNLGNMVETSLREAFSTEPSTVLHPCGQQYDTQASLEATQSATSYLHSYDAPEVTSAPNISEQNHHRTKEEDFLEIDDLLGPEPSFPDMGYSGDNLRFKEADGLDGPDLYLDAAMFLHDMGPIDQGTTSQPYFDTLQVDMANQLNYQLPSQPDDADHISNQLWTHDQRSNVFVASGSNQVVMSPPTSGVVHVGSSTNIIETQQNQGNAGEASDSWFSSALWAFVESMPTPPASASENALINRAFERMSSFGRVRINARNTDVATGQATPAGRRVGGNRGFVFLSVLGAICAVLWMLMIGTTVKVLKTFLGRFISS